jgi:hypothetical protein
VSGSGRSGLGWDKSQSPAVPEFIAVGGNFRALGEGKCLSGCMNVQVTVTDKKTDAPVQGAAVSASVSPFTPNGLAPYPTGFEADGGHLCSAEANSPGVCGPSLSGTQLPPTDAGGQVRFLYWAPGAIRNQTVKISVTAEKSCANCPAGRRSGQGNSPVTISPHIIFTGVATLKPDAMNLLETWAANDNNFVTPNNELARGLGKQLLENSFKAVVDGALKVSEGPLAGPILAFEAVHELHGVKSDLADLNTEIGQKEALTALFTNPLGLSTAGLGSVNAAEFDPAFLEAIAGKNGLLRSYGLALAKVNDRLPIISQDVKLALYEVSYCKQGKNCGPGESTPGIEPFLYFDFQADTPASSQTGAGQVFPPHALVLPYDPVYFSYFQFRGKGPPGG